MMEGIPRTVMIGGRRWKVAWDDLGDDWGQCDGDERKITLCLMRIRTIDQARETLAHEMTHAALSMGGLSQVLGPETEEAVVRCLDNLLWPAVKRLEC